MNNKYEFFIAGRARNKENILKICDLFDKYNISYYCFLKNEEDWGYGNSNQTPEEKQREFESLGLKSEVVLNLFNQDLDGEKNSKKYTDSKRNAFEYLYKKEQKENKYFEMQPYIRTMTEGLKYV